MRTLRLLARQATEKHTGLKERNHTRVLWILSNKYLEGKSNQDVEPVKNLEFDLAGDEEMCLEQNK